MFPKYDHENKLHHTKNKCISTYSVHELTQRAYLPWKKSVLNTLPSIGVSNNNNAVLNLNYYLLKRSPHFMHFYYCTQKTAKCPIASSLPYAMRTLFYYMHFISYKKVQIPVTSYGLSEISYARYYLLKLLTYI